MQMDFKPNRINHRDESTDISLPHLLCHFEIESTLHLERLTFKATVADLDLGSLNRNVSTVYRNDGATFDGDRCEEGIVITLAEEALQARDRFDLQGRQEQTGERRGGAVAFPIPLERKCV